MILDESSMLKSMYGTWGQRLIDLGKGLQWKLCLTGTPAPNDRIEYGNHAVFLDRVPTLNAFLAKSPTGPAVERATKFAKDATQLAKTERDLKSQAEEKKRLKALEPAPEELEAPAEEPPTEGIEEPAEDSPAAEETAP
jgi:hypothetical protein